MRQFTAFPDDTRNSTGVHFDLVDVSTQHFQIEASDRQTVKIFLEL